MASLTDCLYRKFQDLRRPTVVKAVGDTTTYWECSVEAWNAVVDLATSTTVSKTDKYNATAKLRKIDAAGRMCETDEGMVAPVACALCEKVEGRVCMVYKGHKEAACAYCRRQGKGGCYAGDPSKAPPPSVEERLSVVEGQIGELVSGLQHCEQRLSALEAGRQQDQSAEVAALKEEIEELKRRLAATGDGFGAIDNRFRVVERHLFRARVSSDE